MGWGAIGEVDDLLESGAGASEDFEAFADAVGGVADDGVEEAGGPERGVGEIGDECAEVERRGGVLGEVFADVAVRGAADAAAVEVGAEDGGAEVCAGEGEGACAHKGVVG